MWMMLQQEEGDDYVVATGESHSVQEFVTLAFSIAGLESMDYVEVDPKYFRATEVDYLKGDPSKAKAQLGWKPRVTFTQLVRMMVEHDIELARQELTLRDAGHVVALRGAAAL
jgi:GDPmannose 4,6-dehydratase